MDNPSLEHLDDGQQIMALLVAEIKTRLQDPEIRKEMKAADFEFLRKFLQDNSITIASVRRGDYGDLVKRVSEEFPFPTAGDTHSFQ